MRDDGDDEKRPKLFWICVRLGHLGKAETGPQSGRRAVPRGPWERGILDSREGGHLKGRRRAAERPKSRSGHPRSGRSVGALRTVADSCGQLRTVADSC